MSCPGRVQWTGARRDIQGAGAARELAALQATARVYSMGWVKWTFTPDGSGTAIRWTYEFKPLRRRYWLVRHMLAPLWRHYMQAGVEAAARVAEER
jgi:Polyketide cyclase / dehydrase and lipid transport